MRGHARSPQADKRKYPLKKVIERDVEVRWNDTSLQWEEGHEWPMIFASRLECGHLIRPARDFYGEIHSEKQRCRLCAKNNS